MDELAAAPASIRSVSLAHIKDARERAVIEAVAKAASWKPGEKGDGVRGRGIGYAKYKTVATYNAVIVEVEIDRASGQVKVPRAWTAVDSGLIINPDGLTNQIEGGIVQSTSWTLHEQVRFDRTASCRATGRATRSYRLRIRPRSRPFSSTSRASARSGPAKPRRARPSRPSPMRSPTPPASACASCRSRPSG